MTWKDIDDIALALVESHPDRDPLSVRFTELRRMVEQLPDFQAQEGHQVNEQILEAIQAAWHEEAEDQRSDDDEDPGYSPVRPFKPDE
ncbi:MAG: Fe-S cluster assembly protein IscX [Phycisphaeraceae bacterium]|nr:Fe-S cluster assembly protein IscX [Phycisphaeraceae bacterium]